MGSPYFTSLAQHRNLTHGVAALVGYNDRRLVAAFPRLRKEPG